jgi:hypothetical protein
MTLQEKFPNLMNPKALSSNNKPDRENFLDEFSQEPEPYEIDPAFDVVGLDSPYVGLRNYTYEDREIYAGRKDTIQAGVQILTTPDTQRTLLFVTGVSGCGKSSYVQAGLLPALEEHYSSQGITVRSGVFRPSYTPLNNLVDVLQKIDIPAEMLSIDAVHDLPDQLSLFIGHTTLPNQVNILIIDQFDEIFTLSETDQRQALFTVLETLPPFHEVRTHIIAPIRSDHLPDLFHHKELYEASRYAIDLRGMSEGELRETILRPIQHMYEEEEKQLQKKLVDRLVQDTVVNAAYLPMLQAALDNIWRQGTLTLESYDTLTHSIERRAESVYRYSDHESDQRYERSNPDKQLMMEILLDLVDTSLEDTLTKDIRRRRTMADLRRGTTTFAKRPAQYQYSLFSSRTKRSPRVKTWEEMTQDHEQKKIDRMRLIEDLYNAGFLVKSLEYQGDIPVEMVEIVHESLINYWQRLQRSVEGQWALVQQRRRVEQFVHHKMSADKFGPRLLDGIQLDETLAMIERGDLILASSEAREIIQRSIQRRKQKRWVARTIIAILSVLIVVVGVAGFALGPVNRWRY